MKPSRLTLGLVALTISTAVFAVGLIVVIHSTNGAMTRQMVLLPKLDRLEHALTAMRSCAEEGYESLRDEKRWSSLVAMAGRDLAAIGGDEWSQLGNRKSGDLLQTQLQRIDAERDAVIRSSPNADVVTPWEQLLATIDRNARLVHDQRIQASDQLVRLREQTQAQWRLVYAALIVASILAILCSLLRLKTESELGLSRTLHSRMIERASNTVEETLAELNNLLSTIPDVIFTVDLHGNMIRWNRRLTDVTGRTDEELGKRSLLDLFAEPSKPAVAQGILDAFERDHAELEANVLAPGDAQIAYEWVIAPLRNPGGSIMGITAAGRDISSRRAAEAALQRSEAHHRTLIENVSDTISILDRDGRILYNSPSVRRMLGYLAERTIGRLTSEFVHPDDYVLFTTRLCEAAHSPVPIPPFEVRLRRQDGTYCTVEVLGHALPDEGGRSRVLATCRDVTDRKRVEEEQQHMRLVLEEVAQEWAHTFDAVQSPIVLLNADGRITRLNAAARALTGGSYAEALQTTIKSLTGEPWATAASVVASGPSRWRAEHIETLDPTNGKTWDVSTSVATTHTEDPRLLIVARDITDRRAVEQVLERRVELERLITTISTAFITLAADDVDRGIENALGVIGRFSAVDRSYVFLFDQEGITGSNTHEWCADGVTAYRNELQDLPVAAFPWWMSKLRAGEVIHMSNLSEFPPEAAGERELVESQGVQSFVVIPMSHGQDLIGFLGFDSNQERHWLPEDITLLRIVGEIFANAVERRRTYSVLRDSEERFRSLSSAAPLGIFQTNAAGENIYTNQQWQTITGLSAKEGAGYGWSVVVHPDDRQYVSDRWRDVVSRGEELDIEARLLLTGGQLKWFSAHARPMMSSAGAIAGYVGTLEDITARKLAEDEREKMQETLRRNETMSVMGSLVAGIAHEVRNPLFSISATLDAFEARFGDTTDYQRYTTQFRAEVERLSNLMHDLLEYGKPHPLALSPGPVEDIVEDAIATAQVLAKKAGVHVVFVRDGDAVAINRDRARLLQVFLNLVENAIQHSPSGNRVMVRMSHRIDENTGCWLQCEVRDTGTGFRPEDLPRVFEPFFTRRRGGTGLGLSIVKRIVEEHGGTINARNHPSGGAQLWVSFPTVTTAAIASPSS